MLRSRRLAIFTVMSVVPPLPAFSVTVNVTGLGFASEAAGPDPVAVASSASTRIEIYLDMSPLYPARSRARSRRFRAAALDQALRTTGGGRRVCALDPREPAVAREGGDGPVRRRRRPVLRGPGR